jgi:hypothetical protein
MLNAIISQLIETEETIDFREFDMWRGMAAGTQAQGSWGNKKGQEAEKGIQSLIRLRLEGKSLLAEEVESHKVTVFPLVDGRRVVFASEPDIAVYEGDSIQVAIEIKGGIDQASAHERYGAISKSFEKPKRDNPKCLTVLVIKEVILTDTAREALSTNSSIDYWFGYDVILADTEGREAFFALLGI